MKHVVAGRKMIESSALKLASAAVANIGVDAAVWVFSPACAVAQIEHV